MGNKNLIPINQRVFVFTLGDVEVFEGRVTGNNNSTDKIQVPFGWKGKKVLVVLKNEHTQ